MRQRPYLLPLIIVTGFALAAMGCTEAPPRNALEKEMVTVTGKGEVRAAPDVFRIRAVSSRQGDNIEAMQQEVNAEIRAALELSESLGMAPGDVDATNIHIQPEWQWQPERKIIGHRVAREIRFRVEGITTYANLLDELTALGFKELHQAGREINNPEGHQEEALAKAIADAQRKAGVLTAAANRTLGRALIIEEETSHLPQAQIMTRSMEAEDTSAYSPGEITIEARVRVAFMLE